MPYTAEKVDWVLGKIADARAARIREHGEAMARQADADADRLLWQFGAALEAFARKETEGTKRRSVRFFHGQIGFRTKPAAFAVTDDVALVWAKENLPGVLRLDRRALADVLAVTDGGAAVVGETGEVLNFVSVQPAEEVFFVR